MRLMKIMRGDKPCFINPDDFSFCTESARFPAQTEIHFKHGQDEDHKMILIVDDKPEDVAKEWQHAKHHTKLE